MEKLFIGEREAERLWAGEKLDDAIPLRFSFTPYHPTGDPVTTAGLGEGWRGNVWRNGSSLFYAYVCPAHRSHGWLAHTRVFTDVSQPCIVKRET